jgi:hypothetical protein
MKYAMDKTCWNHFAWFESKVGKQVVDLHSKDKKMHVLKGGIEIGSNFPCSSMSMV